MTRGTRVRPQEALAQHAVLAGVIVLVVVTITMATTMLPVRPYVATVQVAFTNPSATNVFGPGARPTGGQDDLTRRTYLLLSPRLRDAVAQRLGAGATATSIGADLTAVPQPDRGVVEVSGRAASPAEAVALVNTVVAEYREQTLQSTREEASALLGAIRARRGAITSAPGTTGPGAGAEVATPEVTARALADLDVRAAEVTLAAARYGDGVAHADLAEVADPGPLRVILLRAVVLGLGAGFVLALALCWLLSTYRPVVRGVRDLGRLTGLPVLGQVEDRARQDPSAPSSGESYQSILTALRAAVPGGILTVVPASHDGPPSSLAVQLAAAAAEEGRRVALVQLDGAPSVSRGPGSGAGLAEAVLGADCEGVEQAVLLKGGARLTVVAPGRTPVAQVVARHGPARLQAYLLLLRARFDDVVIDAPEGLLSPDAHAVALHSDAVLLHVRAGSSARALQRASGVLAALSPGFVGAVLTPRAPTASQPLLDLELDPHEDLART